MHSLIQLGSLILSRFGFYVVSWGYFAPLKIPLKLYHTLQFLAARIWLRIGIHQIFQMKYHKSFLLKKPSNLAVMKKFAKSYNLCTFWTRFYALNRYSSEGPRSSPGWGEIWEPVALHSFGLKGHIIPHLKARLYL